MFIAGEELRAIRKAKGFKRCDLALKSGVSCVQITNIEKKGMIPNAQTLYKIASALEYDYDKLYDLFQEQKELKNKK